MELKLRQEVTIGMNILNVKLLQNFMSGLKLKQYQVMAGLEVDFDKW